MSKQIILNHHALDQYIDMMGEEGAEFVIEIIDTFLMSAPDNFTQLDHSLAAYDSVTFRRAAHTLKSGCTTVGATALAENFLKLEEAGAAGNLTTVGDLLEQCKNDYKILLVELKQKKETV